MALHAICAFEGPGSFLRTSAGRIGSLDRSVTLRLLEITRQPDLASCCTWSISTAGVPHATRTTTRHHWLDQPGHRTDHTNQLTYQTLKNLECRVDSRHLEVLMVIWDTELVQRGGEDLQLLDDTARSHGGVGVHRGGWQTRERQTLYTVQYTTVDSVHCIHCVHCAVLYSVCTAYTVCSAYSVFSAYTVCTVHYTQCELLTQSAPEA